MILRQVQDQKIVSFLISYDNSGRISELITPVNDTSTYTYSSNKVVIDIPYTFDDGTGPVVLNYQETYFLNANSLAAYSLTSAYGFVLDSTVYTYDAIGQLQTQAFYDFFSGDD